MTSSWSEGRVQSCAVTLVERAKAWRGPQSVVEVGRGRRGRLAGAGRSHRGRWVPAAGDAAGEAAGKPVPGPCPVRVRFGAGLGAADGFQVATRLIKMNFICF